MLMISSATALTYAILSFQNVFFPVAFLPHLANFYPALES